MVTNYEPVYHLNAYLLHRWRQEGLTFHATDPNWNPFWPVSQEPETVQDSGTGYTYPWVRYNVRYTNSPNLLFTSGRAVYAVFSEDIMESAHMMNIAKHWFERGAPESSEPLNIWLADNGRNEFLFYYTEFGGGGNVEPGAEEGGMTPRIFSISFAWEMADKPYRLPLR